MSISPTPRSRPILKRPGKQLPSAFDTQPSPNALTDPTSVAPEDEEQESVSEPERSEEDNHAEQVEEIASSEDSDFEADSTLEQPLSRSGRTLDWSGFPIDMGSAISKELLTDWRFDC